METGNLSIKCKSCGKVIPAADIHLETGLAKCAACNGVFSIGDQVQAREKTTRGPASLPDTMTVASDSRSLTVVRRWKRGPAFMVLGGAIFWNLIVSVFVVALLSGAEFKESSTGKPASAGFMWLFMTPFILVGISAGYVALAMMLNRTTIRLEPRLLSVSHGPMWWWGQKSIDPSRVTQMFCTEYVAYTQNNRPVHKMCVNAILADGGRVELIKGLDEPGQAFYLEHVLENRLLIEDRPVHGEFQNFSS